MQSREGSSNETNGWRLKSKKVIENGDVLLVKAFDNENNEETDHRISFLRKESDVIH